MYRLLFPMLVLLLAACGGSAVTGGDGEEAGGDLAEQFRKAELPYTLTDTAVQQEAEGDTLRGFPLTGIPDSVRARVASGGGPMRLYPMVRIAGSGEESYLIMKAVAGSRSGALIAVYDRDTLRAVAPFLIPDNDRETVQFSTIDAGLSVSRSVHRMTDGGISAEGREVYGYNRDAGGFTLILTDILDETRQELINPIDTLPRTHPLAGDYGTGRRNIVSLRDGRNPRSLRVFVHIESEGAACTGELKGELLLTSANAALYRQAGDPCVLRFRFTKNAVTLEEEEGCGSRRGIDCSFNATFKKRVGSRE